MSSTTRTPSLTAESAAWLADTFARNRAAFGCTRMEDAPPAGGDGGEGGQPKGGDKPPEYTPPATQADLDRIVSQRLAREREKFSDYDALKAKADEFDKATEANKTEQQKAIDEARKAGTTEALSTVNARIVNAEARAIASAAGFRNANLAVSAVDLSAVKVGDNGEVDTEAIKAKLKELSDAEPYLIDDGKPRPKPDAAQGGGSGGAKPSTSAGRDLYAERYGTKTPA